MEDDTFRYLLRLLVIIVFNYFLINIILTPFIAHYLVFLYIQTPSAVPGSSIHGAYPYLTHTLPGGMTPNQQAQLIQEMGLPTGQVMPPPGSQLPMGLAKNKNDKLEVMYGGVLWFVVVGRWGEQICNESLLESLFSKVEMTRAHLK